jgi:hypothetical protein
MKHFRSVNVSLNVSIDRYRHLAGDRNLLIGMWRPVRESNPCRRREREGTYCNSTELRGMDSTLPHSEDSEVLLLDLMDSRLSLLPTQAGRLVR